MITGLGGTGPNSLASVSISDSWLNHQLPHPPTGFQLKKMLERAWKWSKIQREAADSMTTTWSEFSPGWKKMLIAYKKDKSKPNPFEEPNPGKRLPHKYDTAN